MQVYIGLGANLNDPAAQVKKAIDFLADHPAFQLIKQSSLYKTAPWGVEDQPDFINAVVEVQTTLKPLELLSLLKAVEQQFGRDLYAKRWGPRVIDLDILLYGNQEIHLPNLTVPHLHLCDREFVLRPLYEIRPDLILPNGRAIVSYLTSVG